MSQTRKYDKRFTAGYQSNSSGGKFRGPKAFPMTVPKTLAFGHDISDTNSLVIIPGVAFGVQDQGTNGVAGTAATLTAAQFPTYNATIIGGKFPGITFAAGDYISVADAAILDYATTGMGFVGVFQLNILPASFRNIFGKSGVGGNTEFSIAVLSTGEIAVSISNDGTAVNQLSTGFIAQVNEPFVIDLCWNTNDFQAYVNGDNHVYAAQDVFNGTSPFFYGDSNGAHDGATAMAEGYFFTQTLTASERVGIRTNLAEKYNITITEKEVIPAVEIGGQSNAEGTKSTFLDAPTPAAYYNAPVPDGYIYDTVDNATEALQGGVNNLGFTIAFYGPEMPIIFRMTDYYNRRCMIIKETQPGSHLASTPGDTSVSHYPEEGDLWFNTIATIDEAFAYERAAGREMQIVLDVWYQGEGDMLDAGYASAYGTNLILYIQTLREYLHKCGYANITVKFIAVKPGPTAASYVTLKPTVNAGIDTAIASEPNCNSVDAANFSYDADNLHLNAAGMIDCGNAIMDEFL